jgi:DNA-binding response OmpR family regulator
MPSDSFAQTDIVSATHRAKLLLVDEEAGDLKTLRLALEGQGFQVLPCPTYDAGVECLGKEAFDFVVVSQGTQAFEGRRVVNRALELDRRCPVLVVTRCLDMACYLEAMQMGAIDYLEKPISPAEILRLVRAHLQHDRSRSRNIEHNAPARL